MGKQNSGMDEAQAQADRAGWKTNVAAVTGGEQKDLESEAGIEVGNKYDTGLGDTASDISYGK